MSFSYLDFNHRLDEKMTPDDERNMYFDFNATTPMDPAVISSISQAMTSAWANPSSSSPAGVQARKLIDESRRNVASAIGAAESDILFVSGGTEANNLVIWTALEHYRRLREKGEANEAVPHIITSNVEHDAVALPLKHYEGRGLALVDYVAVSNLTGRVDCETVIGAIRPNTCLVSIMLANNETGILMPVAPLFSSLKEINLQREKQGMCRILLHSDAAQAIGKVPVDVRELSVDYLTIVGHKFYGPRIGALYAKDLTLGNTPLHPMFFGGGQERGLRPGTENTAMIAGLGIAAQLVSQCLDDHAKTMREMRDLLETLLHEVLGDAVKFNCSVGERLPNTCSVSFPASTLSGREILARCPHLLASTGAACHRSGQPSAVLMASGVSPAEARSAVRLSVGRETTAHQIRRLVDMIRNALDPIDP